MSKGTFVQNVHKYAWMYWFSLIETNLCGLRGFGYAVKLRNDLRLKPSYIE